MIISILILDIVLVMPYAYKYNRIGKSKANRKREKALHSKECSPQHRNGENCPCPKKQEGYI